MQKRVRQLELLKSCILAAKEDDALRAMTAGLVELSGAKHGSIFIKNGKILKRIYSSIPNDKRLVPRKKGYTYRCLWQGKPYYLPRSTMIKNHPEMATEVKGILLLPVLDKDTAMGVVSLQFYKPRQLDDLEIRELVGFAETGMASVKKAAKLEEAEKALSSRDLFISMASHELKNPMTTIKAFVQLMERKKKKGGEIPWRWLETLERETNRLNNLVNELLHLEQINKGSFRYDFSKSDLKDLLEKAAIFFNNLHKDHQLEIDQNGVSKAYVFADEDKLLQVLTNILNNAAKFSPKGSTVRLELHQDGGNYLVKVMDQGKGIDQEDLDKIFDVFYKGDETSDGFGVGLYLVKEIVGKHNGLIEIESKPGKGTQVSIQLPPYHI
jgi:signal transduction histidine kinase